MSKEDVKLFTCYGARASGRSYMEHLRVKDKEIERLNNKLEEFKEEHKIMKQILIENNLWENLLNDDRFLEYLRK